MPNTIITPNMDLVLPIVGQEAGPQYAQDVNNSLIIIDGHNHSPGSGVQITPSGLNINTTFAINDQLLSSVGGLNLVAQITPPSNSTLYANGNNLWFVDGAGNNIQFTSAGAIVGAPGTISGLFSPASASYSSVTSTFTFQSAALTAANLDAGSIVLRDLTASSFGLTLSPPVSLASNYTIVLPVLPSITEVVTLASNGNMGTQTYDQIGQNMTTTGADAIAASMNNTGATAIFNTFSRGLSGSAALGGFARSNSCGNFTTTSTGDVQLTNSPITLNISGNKPVFIMLQPDGSSNSGTIGGESVITFTNGGTGIARFVVSAASSAGAVFGPGCCSFIYYPGGSPTTLGLAVNVHTTAGGNIATISNCVLVAYEF